MRTENIQGKIIVLRRLEKTDIPTLADYLQLLSHESRMRFGPHGFDKASLDAVFSEGSPHTGYLALEEKGSSFIAYAIVRRGFLGHDAARLESHGLKPDPHKDATFAPSVADDWQGRGLGPRMFAYIREDLRTMGIQRIILWGGVQQSNERAVRYYQRLGFLTLGAFEYQGMNFDMVLDI
jgi:GNAT superfamily N-acetyltransferase